MDAAMSAPEQTFVMRIAGMPEAAARRLADALGELLDAQETAVSLFESAGGWSVAAHFHHRPDAALATLIAQQAGADAASRITTELVGPQDWVGASLAGLTPVRAGRVFLHGAHDRGRAPPNAIAIEIEAALAFGTGHHGTTQGCLLALDAVAKARRPRRILDLGTGTGVLAIAAAKALRRPVLASDIDPQAVGVARANVRANRVSSLVTVVQAAGLAGAQVREAAPYDLIFANILLGPLQRLAAPLARLTAPGGRVVLSGLLARQASAALAPYRLQHLYLEQRLVLDGWATLVLVAGCSARP
jgi:ribosomal protein L11 methyltransferase